MKKLIALAVVIFVSQPILTFAGEPISSSKEVISPAPPPPPVEYFRGNEFDIGAFGTYATGLNSNNGIHGWGGGIDLTYWFPWKYAGVRFQGAGVSIRGGGGSRTFNPFPGVSEPVTVTGGGNSVAAGILTGDFMLRLPLDSFWPNFHLAPYTYAGFGGIILGSGGGDGRTVSETFTVTNNATGQTREVTATGRAVNRARSSFGTDRFLGHVGADSNIALLPISGFSAKLLMSSRICQTITLYRRILASDSPSS